MPDQPLLLRVPQETRDALAGTALLADIEVESWAAWDTWATLDVPTGYATPHAYAARRVLDHLASRCAVEALAGTEQSPALRLIAAERLRQVEVKGYGARHDDEQHRDGELAQMARWYADEEAGVLEWPGDLYDPVPHRDGLVRDLVRAAALIAAAIDQLGRKGWQL